MWRDIKKTGSKHYKEGGVEPIDLMRAGGYLHGFACGNVVKYAHRSRKKINKRDMRKIIHYAEMLIDLEVEREKKKAKNRRAKASLSRLRRNTRRK